MSKCGPHFPWKLTRMDLGRKSRAVILLSLSHLLWDKVSLKPVFPPLEEELTAGCFGQAGWIYRKARDFSFPQSSWKGSLTKCTVRFHVGTKMAGLWYLTEFFQAGSFTLSPATFLDGAQESPPWRTPQLSFCFALPLTEIQLPPWYFYQVPAPSTLVWGPSGQRLLTLPWQRKKVNTDTTFCMFAWLTGSRFHLTSVD